jgi:hypothetical protein
MYSREWMAKMRRKEARKKKRQLLAAAREGKKLESLETGNGTTSSRADPAA